MEAKYDRNLRRLWSKDRFIYESELIHGELYDYSLFEYVGANVKGVIVCKRCGKSFEQTPSKHINGKQGCGDCNYKEAQEERYRRYLDKKFEGIIQPEEYKIIPLSKGFTTKVSNEDFDLVRGISWKYSKGYAGSTKYGSLHRYIMKPPKDLFVDHINRVPLDNRRENLRLVTPRESTYNISPYGVSKYKGVTFSGERIKVQLIYKGSKVLDELVETEEQGARLFDIYALYYQKEFAYLNFPENVEEYKKEIKKIFKGDK